VRNILNITQQENLKWLRGQEDAQYHLIYIDPPFNTGKRRNLHAGAFDDRFGNYMEFIKARLREAYRVLRPDGTLCVHLDWREVHYVKVFLDELFGRECFLNEIVWAYDYGGRSKKKWSSKHDTILIYVKDPKNYAFNFDAMDRIPYMAPGLVGPEKAARGKTPNDCWWHTIVPTQGSERTGYPTQKPLGILERIVKVHSNPDDNLLDFFAGSGSFGEAALRNQRNVDLVDNNKEACEIAWKRLSPRVEHSMDAGCSALWVGPEDGERP